LRLPGVCRLYAPPVVPTNPCLLSSLLLNPPARFPACLTIFRSSSWPALPPSKICLLALPLSPSLCCSKAPIQAFADRVSAVFVPVVAVLAVLTWALWYCAGLAGWYPASWLPQASAD